MIEILPASGPGGTYPSDLGDAVAVISFVAGAAGPAWTVECFVKGAANRDEARDAAAGWLGQPRLNLLATKVGGNAGKVEVLEREPPGPPPPLVAREWDESADEPEGRAEVQAAPVEG